MDSQELFNFAVSLNKLQAETFNGDQTLYGLKALVYEMNGSWINWTCISEGEITEEYAKYLQTKERYPPAGYNFIFENVNRSGNGLFITRWKSYSSCD